MSTEPRAGVALALARAEREPAPGALAVGRRWLRAHVTDEWLVALLAITLSIAFFAWYDAHGLTAAFNDARIREMIARRVLMSRTPGLAQFGTTWLPLPGMLMLPLIWNDTLLRDGIAGSFPSMLAYVLAAVYMYRLARLLASSRVAGWMAAGILMLNGSVLYTQGTAMSEIPSISTFVIAIYYASRLIHSYHALDLVKCATAVAAGTLIRYEDWALAIAILPVLAYVAWRRRRYVLAEAWTILYSLLAFAGCAAWVLYNAVIFHDPLLSFYYGDSSHTYYAHTPGYLLPARHHALLALTTYSLTVADTVGWVLVAIALLGFAVFARRAGLRRTALPAYLTLVPFGFYWLALYRGANTETLPGAGAGALYNVRFGLAMVPAAALFAAFVTMARAAFLRRALCGIGLAAITVTTIIGSAQTPLVVREALQGAAGARSGTQGQIDSRWLSERYHGGNVLITYVNSASMVFYLLTQHRFPDRALITDANGPQFASALAHPEDWVTWIVMDSDASNGKSKIWAALHDRGDWQRFFILRKSFGTTQIYSIRTTAGTGSSGSAAPGASGLAAVQAAAAARESAAAWISAEVGHSTVMSCDPAMCAVLGARRFPAGDLMTLGPVVGDPLGSAVVVSTAAVRDLLGTRLTSVYAPAVIASFGSGDARVDVRVYAAGGAPAYLAALRADQLARQDTGRTLLRNRRVIASQAARRQLAAGQVDSRLLITIATLASEGPGPVQIVGFGDSGPGASAGMPLREVEIAVSPPGAARGYLPSVLAFLRAQRVPYLARSVQTTFLPGAQEVVRIVFDAPSPLGLLSG